MNGALARLGGVFLQPAQPPGPAEHATSEQPERDGVPPAAPASPVAEPVDAPGSAASGAAVAVGVLCRPADGALVGAAVALGVRGGTVLLCLWGARPATLRAPGTLGARRLAARLRARGHDARAGGRLVVVAVSAGIDEAARAAAASDAPAVLAVAGPRDERVDAVLRSQDRVLAAGDGLVAELAAQGVAADGVPARTLALPRAPAARALAASGIVLAAPLRPVVLAALR